MDTISNDVAVNTLEGMELEEGKDLIVKCKRTKFSVSIVQPQQGVEVPAMENKMGDVLVHKVSVGKDPLNRLTDCAVQSNGDAGGCIKGHTHVTPFAGSAGDEPARSRLLKICRASRWKEPSYNFEEQGPPHSELFTCMVTVHVEAVVNMVLECFGGPKRQKEAAQEHAAQGALWCLAHYGHVK